MNRTDIESKLIIFLKRCTRYESFDYDQRFQEMGIFNSLLMMQLILFIEREFNLSVRSEDLRNNTLSSINNIIAYVDNKKEATSAS